MDRSLKKYLHRTSNDLITLASVLLQRADNIQKFIATHNRLGDNNQRTEDAMAFSDEGCGETMAPETSTESDDESEDTVISETSTSDQSSSDSMSDISMSDDAVVGETTFSDSELSVSDDDSLSVSDDSSLSISDASDF